MKDDKGKRQRRAPRKHDMTGIIKRNIPNIITCCNLISGCIATAFALSGNMTMALAMIIVGAGFDFFDGWSARMIGITSPIGKELDSLADDVTFGVAPSAMLFYELSVMDYPVAIEPLRSWLPYTAFIMAAFAALRLAKFNIDARQTTSFIGVPTPANALFWASLIAGSHTLVESTPWMVVAVVALMLASCWAMVSEMPMFALKFKHYSWRGNETRYIFLIVCLPLIAIFRLSSLAVIIIWYVILSAITAHKK